MIPSSQGLLFQSQSEKGQVSVRLRSVFYVQRSRVTLVKVQWLPHRRPPFFTPDLLADISKEWQEDARINLKYPGKNKRATVKGRKEERKEGKKEGRGRKEEVPLPAGKQQCHSHLCQPRNGLMQEVLYDDHWISLESHLFIHNYPMALHPSHSESLRMWNDHAHHSNSNIHIF